MGSNECNMKTNYGYICSLFHNTVTKCVQMGTTYTTVAPFTNMD